MKKYMIVLSAAAVLAASSCSKEPVEVQTPAEEAGTVTLFGQYPAISSEGETKVDVSGNAVVWSADDALGVFTASSKSPSRFGISGGAGTANGSFSGKIIDEGAAGDVYAIYPYKEDELGLDVVPSAVKINFNGQTQDGFGANAEAHLGAFTYMASSPVKLSNGKASVEFYHLAVKMAFEFSLPVDCTVKFLTMTTTLNKFYGIGVVDLTASNPVAKGWGTATRSFSLGFKNSKVSAGQKVTAYAMMLPADLASSAITFYVSVEKADGTPATYTVKKSSALKFEAAKSYTAELPSVSKYNTGEYDMVFVPGGSLNICGIFTSEDKADVKAVADKDYRVDSFWIGKTEVTNQQYCDFLNRRQPGEVQLNSWITEGICQIEDQGDGYYVQKWVPKSGPILNADGTTTVGSYADFPMIGVTGLGANAYSANMAEKVLGYPEKDSGYYLPTEAQWEYAAVGSEWNANWANEMIAGCDYDADFNKYMWSCKNCDSAGSSCLGVYIGNGSDPNSVSGSGSKTGGTHPVAGLLPNYLGIYDMSGNVGEICSDYYNASSYPYGSSLNPRNSSYTNAEDTGEAGYARVVRGGMWFSFPSEGITYSRDCMGQAASYNFTGFRMVLPLK